MTDRHAFIKSIRDNPRDMTTRLVFADWLDDQAGGEETRRAWLIRNSVRLTTEFAEEYLAFVKSGLKLPLDPTERMREVERLYGQEREGWRWVMNGWKAGVATDNFEVEYEFGIVVRIKTNPWTWAHIGPVVYEEEFPDLVEFARPSLAPRRFAACRAWLRTFETQYPGVKFRPASVTAEWRLIQRERERRRREARADEDEMWQGDEPM